MTTEVYALTHSPRFWTTHQKLVIAVFEDEADANAVLKRDGHMYRRPRIEKINYFSHIFWQADQKPNFQEIKETFSEFPDPLYYDVSYKNHNPLYGFGIFPRCERYRKW